MRCGDNSSFLTRSKPAAVRSLRTTSARPRSSPSGDFAAVIDLALRLSTRCATANRRGGDPTQRLLNAVVLDEVPVHDGRVVDAAYKEPFDLLCSSLVRSSNTAM